MTANAQAQVARMLELVPYLQDRDGIPVANVARDFEVPPAQIVKDLKVLWFCGLPNSVSGDMIDIDMDALEGEGVVRLTNADYLTRPLRLTRHEALSLLVALRTLHEAAGPDERDAVDRARRKLEAATGDGGTQAAAVDIHIDEADPEIRARVDQSLRDRRRLHLTYYVPGRDETTERDADPIRLVFAEGNGYLEAWCHSATETRLFRLDRITSAEVTDAPADPPADAAVLDLSQGIFQPDPDDPVALLELDRSARWVADYYPIEEQAETASGGLRVRLKYDDERWLRRLVLQLGGTATVLEPAELAASVRARAGEA
ncbi:MAG: helix-turn-helix transcriptional regulator, partial [Nocardioidaceae bacterium]